jgi:hypothetical protein
MGRRLDWAKANVRDRIRTRGSEPADAPLPPLPEPRWQDRLFDRLRKLGLGKA